MKNLLVISIVILCISTNCFATTQKHKIEIHDLDIVQIRNVLYDVDSCFKTYLKLYAPKFSLSLLNIDDIINSLNDQIIKSGFFEGLKKSNYKKIIPEFECGIIEGLEQLEFLIEINSNNN